ncbi:hypothetical protein KLP28_14075 [Nocardioidaceae bacterium]|nr:hypothetical protein KLP28_14075 [Nocardioidaceae bacterium]
MGLTDRLLTGLRDAGTARPHVLLVELPGGRGVRRAVEDALDERGWPRAVSPGAADVLLLAGEVGDPLLPYVDRVHAQLPGPAARIAVSDPADVDDALDRSRVHLGHAERQAAASRTRPDPSWVHRAEDEPAEPGPMAPSGIPLAGGAEDRDDLEMDALHVPLGPVLPHWPAGLVLHSELHGDVVADVRVARFGHDVPPRDAGEATARVLDAASHVLALAGDDRRALRVRSLRRRVLADVTGTRAQTRVDLARLEQTFRSRLVARSLGDPALAVADLLAGTRGPHAPMPDVLSAEGLREAVVGRDVGEVRLLVAALSPRLRSEAPATSSGGPRPGAGVA